MSRRPSQAYEGISPSRINPGIRYYKRISCVVRKLTIHYAFYDIQGMSFYLLLCPSFTPLQRITVFGFLVQINHRGPGSNISPSRVSSRFSYASPVTPNRHSHTRCMSSPPQVSYTLVINAGDVMMPRCNYACRVSLFIYVGVRLEIQGPAAPPKSMHVGGWLESQKRHSIPSVLSDRGIFWLHCHYTRLMGSTRFCAAVRPRKSVFFSLQVARMQASNMFPEHGQRQTEEIRTIYARFNASNIA